MSKVFVTKEELVVVKGYLSTDAKKMSPVNHPEFIVAQKQAEYIMLFAEKAKGKNFKETKVDSLTELKEEVEFELNSKTKISYIDTPKEPKRDINAKLRKEALAFIDFGKEKVKTSQINDFMAKFDIIHEFEEIGLFFEQEVQKLDKIYTVKEITEAVTSCIDLLD